MSNEVVKSDEQTLAKRSDADMLKDLLGGEKFKNAIAAILPKHLTAERMARVAISALGRVPKLAQCDQKSFFSCMMTLSQLGLEPDGRRAHLIPYGNQCTLIIDYKGLVELIMRTGNVSSIHADVICQNDEFEYDCGEVKKHLINFKKERGEMYAVYCIITFKDGTKKSEVMSKKDVDKIRSRSRSGSSGPWFTDYDEMAKKTVFKRASKWVQLSSEVAEAIKKDDEEYEMRIYENKKSASPLDRTSIKTEKQEAIPAEAKVEPVKEAPASDPDDLPYT
jgi:recombination protein RecT